MFHDLARNVFGAEGSVVDNSPIYHQFRGMDGEEMLQLLQLRVLCYAKSTWFNYHNSIKPYLNFCIGKIIEPYPVNHVALE